MNAMQPLDRLDNVQKARLIHALFLNEIPSFLDYVTELSAYMAEHEAEVRKVWTNNPFFGVDIWLQLATGAADCIKKYRRPIEKSSTKFADELFGGYGAIFLNHCLSEYAKREETHAKFKIAVELFINP